MNTPSETIQRVLGTYIEDAPESRPPVIQWIECECRHGCYREIVEKFAKDQPEPLRADLVLVNSVTPEKILLSFPGKILDHESPTRFEISVMAELTPTTCKIVRR